MVFPEIKSMVCIDLELEEGGVPPDPERCSYAFEVEIGTKGGEGADIFSFVVITLQELLTDTNPRWGRSLLIVEFFSWPLIEKKLNALLSQCSGKDWIEVAAKLNRYLAWEYDNYQK